MSQTPSSIGVVITTYNSPKWLELVLFGYENQSDSNFTVLIADDGSTDETKDVIERFKSRGKLALQHHWQPDDGFQKTKILNKVIASTDGDYLIFTDGDCIPRSDFIAVHRAFAEPGYFLSGGYLKLTMPVSEAINEAIIKSQAVFEKRYLLEHGQPKSFKLHKLTRNNAWRNALNALTPTKATWNGMNSSGWREDIVAVNGYDERMQYGGLDRELGERLWNAGIKSKQIRYHAICLHLDHPRGYSKPEIWEFNNALRQEVRKEKISWTKHGIVNEDRTR
jgi:glycosyltransferase involved in cell wall biosynthesis